MKLTVQAPLVAMMLALAGTPALAKRHEITVDDLAAFKVGVTTYSDVIAALGKPMSESADSQGDRTLAYMVTRTHINAATFIPYVGLFFAGSSGSTTMVVLAFGPDGHLMQYSSSSTAMNCSFSVFNAGCKGGMYAPPAAPVAPTLPAPPQPSPAQVQAQTGASPQPVASPPPATVAQATPAPPQPAAQSATTRAPAPKAKHCGLSSPTDPDAVTC